MPQSEVIYTSDYEERARLILQVNPAYVLPDFANIILMIVKHFRAAIT